MTCSGCGGEIVGRRSHAKWCSNACAMRTKRAGKGARTGVRGRPRKPAYRVLDNGCWEWLLSRNGGGYGQVWRDGTTRIAHIWFWVQKNGPVPAGRELHHRCENRGCVNPDHLEALTRAEHIAAHRR